MKRQRSILYIAAILIAITASSIHAGDNKPLHEIPFIYEMDKVIVPVSINGTKAIRCILDTGMPEGVFLMNPAAAKGMNLQYGATNVMLRGAGSGSESASMAMGASVTLAKIAFENQRIIVLNNAGPLAALGVDGVIGASIFNRFVVEMDVEKKMLRLFGPDKFDSKDAGDSFDLTVTRTKPYITAPVNIDGKTDLPLTLVVDSGASSALMLVEKPDNGVAAPAKSIDGIAGRGVGGQSMGKIARANRLKLGKHNLERVITRFRTDPLPGNADGLIGMKVLERFLVTFDYPGKRMFLKPNRSYSRPFEFSLIGLSVLPIKGGRLEVDYVYKGSAASEVGIKKGDVIVSVDKKHLSFAEYSDLDESLVAPGRKIEIEIERDGVRQIKSLSLRRIL
jgi:hypothetical protein